MNGYKAFYKNQETDVYAETSFEAQEKAAKFFRAKKQHMVSVYLCEKDSKPVIRTAVD